MRRFVKKIFPFVALLLLIGVVIGGSYLIFDLARQESEPRTIHSMIVQTATTPPLGTIPPFAALDPTLAAQLYLDQPFTSIDGTLPPIPGIPPLGMYLPAVREIPQVILAPTQLPPEVTTIDPLSLGLGEILEYGGSGCAPSGQPANGILTQYYHSRHPGIDVGVLIGTPVQATHSGDVIFAGWNSYGYGYLVIIQNEEFITYYAHLSNFNVKAGDEVGRGSIIAWSGSTGNSSGPHIHYETRIDDVPVDPLTFEDRGYETC